MAASKDVAASNIERTVFLVSAVLVGLALSKLVPEGLAYGIATVVVAMVCVGTDHIIHLHWRVHLRKKRYILTLLILPGLVTLGAFLFIRLPFFSTGPTVVVGLLATAVLLFAVITCQYHTIDVADPAYPVARFTLNLICYLTAFSLFAAIYFSKLRSSMSGTAIVITSILIALELLRGTEADVQKTWLFAIVIGAIMGQVTWALNYWVISGLAGGFLLLVVFYLLSGIVQNHLLGKLTPRLAVEFGLVGLAGLALVMSSGFWLQTI